MNNILKNAENADRLLKLTSDTMILMDKEGVCVDIAVHNVDLWFLNEKQLLGKNLFRLLPSATRRQIYPEFQKVLNQKVRISRNYELTLGNTTYFFKCNMYPYDNMVLCQYRDITKRSKQKLELEKKNYELNEIQKAALIGRWRYESDIRMISYHGHTGMLCSTEERYIMLDTYLQYILREDWDSFNTWLEKTQKGNLEESIDFRIYYNNQIYYSRLKAYSYEREKNGKVTLEGYVQNITDIQQRRNDISLLTHAINNSTEDIFAARRDGSLVFANRRFKEHYNIGNTEDITQLNFATLPASLKSQQIWDNMLSTIKKGKANNNFIIYHPLEAHPEILAYEGNAYWVTSDEGEETMWVFGKDISQRLKHEQQIKLFNRILDKIIEHLPAGIIVKDIHNNFKYLYRNRENSTEQLPAQEIRGKDDFDFYPLETAQEKRKQDLQIVQSGKEMHWISEEHDAQGNTIYLDKRKMKIESKDFSPILLSIEWDITETEAMKRELLVAKEKAEASDQLKSAFLANMSHEIRTPLNAIVGFSRIIAESQNAEERLSYYEIVETNNERLLQLINEILDLSKIEAGIVEFNTLPVHLSSLCKEIYDAHIFRCPKGVELIYEPSDQDIVINGDKNRIFQVISNLIGNAFKFTTQGNISYGYRREGDYLTFHVSDTGIGIPANKLSSIFERFVKVNDFAQGTGLGLSICKTIIECMGGTISVSSQPGKGTTFTFTLPLGSPDKEKAPEATKTDSIHHIQIEDTVSIHTSHVVNGPITPPSRQETVSAETKKTSSAQPKILIAEDTDSNYMLLKTILASDYHIERAKDGMDAIDLFEKTQPDLILMDIKMPRLNGLDATRVIRKLSPEIPVIALTAYAYEQDRQEALEAGCSAFLTKPFTQEQLKGLIQKWLK